MGGIGNVSEKKQTGEAERKQLTSAGQVALKDEAGAKEVQERSPSLYESGCGPLVPLRF